MTVITLMTQRLNKMDESGSHLASVVSLSTVTIFKIVPINNAGKIVIILKYSAASTGWIMHEKTTASTALKKAPRIPSASETLAMDVAAKTLKINGRKDRLAK
ncbi:hypothetical protein [Bartonella sp. HY038]|uniref:hypothetical protein n=1 Tax=Bartonella sp. HY038 TaxID=2759660 RepID=UPI0015FB0FE5|nr:hypothetical protein [Bartonella sp. HY038]